jgi:hypothetical protein
MPKNQKRRSNPVIPAEAGIQSIADFVLIFWNLVPAYFMSRQAYAGIMASGS